MQSVAMVVAAEKKARDTLAVDALHRILALSERGRRRLLCAEFETSARAVQRVADGMHTRARSSADVLAARRKVLRQRVRGRARGGPVPGPAGCGWRGEPLARFCPKTDRATELLRALTVRPPPCPEGVATLAQHAAAERAIEEYERVRRTGLERAVEMGVIDASDSANEAYVTSSAVQQARLQLLCEPFNGRAGAVAVVRQLLWTLCRGCRQQRAALAARRDAVSGYDPRGFLGGGRPLPAWSAAQTELTILTSGPFLAMSPTADLLGNVAAMASLCGGLGTPVADPCATEADRREASGYLRAAAFPVAELGTQLGTFLPDDRVDAGWKPPEYGTLTKMRVPVGWPRPVVDPAAAACTFDVQSLLDHWNDRCDGAAVRHDRHGGVPPPLSMDWVVPQDRRWSLRDGWHTGTGLPPTLDLLAAVVPVGGTVLRSVAVLCAVRARLLCAIFGGGDDAVQDGMLNADCMTDRERLWMQGLRLAMSEARE